jgi:hypothetical protein
MKNRLASVLTLLFCMSGLISAQKSLDLQYSLQKGQKYYLNQTTSQTIHQTIQGMANDMEMDFGGKIDFDVVDVQNDVYQIQIKYETMVFKMKSPMMNMAFDSQNQDSIPNPMTSAFKAIMATTFEASMNRKGQIISFSGYESFYKSLVDSLGGNTAMADQVATSLKQQFGDDAMKSSFEAMTRIYPDKKVKVGESWEIVTLINSGMKLTNSSQYKLVEVKDGNWVIQGKSLLATGEDSSMQMGAFTSKFALSGNTSSEMNLNGTTGWLQTSTSSSTIEGKVIVNGQGLPAPMEIPMSIVSDSKVTN